MRNCGRHRCTSGLLDILQTQVNAPRRCLCGTRFQSCCNAARRFIAAGGTRSPLSSPKNIAIGVAPTFTRRACLAGPIWLCEKLHQHQAAMTSRRAKHLCVGGSELGAVFWKASAQEKACSGPVLESDLCPPLFGCDAIPRFGVVIACLILHHRWSWCMADSDTAGLGSPSPFPTAHPPKSIVARAPRGR